MSVNLYEETLASLKHKGKTPNDIKWLGTRTHKISWEQFEEVSKKANYDWGFGSQKVAKDLIIVGEDWYMTRDEYDGQEWWHFHTLPKEPTETLEIKALTVDQAEELDYSVSCGWEDLLSINGQNNEEDQS